MATSTRDAILAQLANRLDRAQVMARAIWKTGMIRGMHPRGVPEAIRQSLKTSSGPSTLFRLHAKNQPDKEAIVFADEARATTVRRTFGEIDRRIDRLAAGLFHNHGLRRGDTAVLVMHNRPEAIEIQAAMSRIGGSAVPVSYRSTPDELVYLVAHSGARAIFVGTDVADAVLAARPRLERVPPESLIGVGRTRDGLRPYERILETAEAAVKEDGDGGAVVIYTSGTTGQPKGAVRKFPKEAQNALFRLLLDAPIRHDDRHLAVCPMYHSTAFGFIGFTFVVGGSIVIEERFEPERCLATIERERVTTAAMVPTMLHRILELPDRVSEKYDTSSLRAIFSGGAPLSGTLARRFMERFGLVLYNFYGATETGINTLATPTELLDSPGTIGHAVPGNEIRLLDDDGHDVGVGETGELYVRNAFLVAGYHRDDEATQRSMRDGFFSVGDLAHVDERGLYHIDGRKRDMIISGGVNVYPAEVEEVLARHAAIAEVAVIGVADEEWGERVKAFVSLRDGKTAGVEEIAGYARAHLSGPKIPREIVILSELPKNPTGKVLKRELRGL